MTKPIKNKLSASEVTARSHKTVIFVCPDCSKKFKAPIYSVARSIENGFTGCYDCAMRKSNAISKPEWFYTRLMLAFAGESGIPNPFFDARCILGENSFMGLDFVDRDGRRGGRPPIKFRRYRPAAGAQGSVFFLYVLPL